MGDSRALSNFLRVSTSLNSVARVFSSSDDAVDIVARGANHLYDKQVIPFCIADSIATTLYGASMVLKEQELNAIILAMKEALEEGNFSLSDGFTIACQMNGQTRKLVVAEGPDNVEIQFLGTKRGSVILENVTDFANLYQKLNVHFARQTIVRMMEDDDTPMKDAFIAVYVNHAKFLAALTEDPDYKKGNGYLTRFAQCEKFIHYARQNPSIQEAIKQLFDGVPGSDRNRKKYAEYVAYCSGATFVNNKIASHKDTFRGSTDSKNYWLNNTFRNVIDLCYELSKLEKAVKFSYEGVSCIDTYGDLVNHFMEGG